MNKLGVSGAEAAADLRRFTYQGWASPLRRTSPGTASVSAAAGGAARLREARREARPPKPRWLRTHLRVCTSCLRRWAAWWASTTARPPPREFSVLVQQRQPSIRPPSPLASSASSSLPSPERPRTSPKVKIKSTGL